jgi:hypothetical protein
VRPSGLSTSLLPYKLSLALDPLQHRVRKPYESGPSLPMHAQSLPAVPNVPRDNSKRESPYGKQSSRRESKMELVDRVCLEDLAEQEWEERVVLDCGGALLDRSRVRGYHEGQMELKR